MRDWTGNVAFRSRLTGTVRPTRSSLILLLLGLFAAVLPVSGAEPAARPAFDAGLRAIAANDYSAAVESFLAAARQAPGENLDPAPAHYNAGLAAYAAGDWEQAAAHFANAVAGAKLGLQARSYYNRGNALFRLAEDPAGMLQQATRPDTLDARTGTLAQAIQMYENAIALDPDDADAKANYELAILRQQELEQMQQEQEQDQDEDGESEPEPQPQDPGEEDQPDSPEPEPTESPADAAPEEQPAPAEPERTDEMTREEAEALLDALREQEQSQRDRLQPFLGQPVPVEKDW